MEEQDEFRAPQQLREQMEGCGPWPASSIGANAGNVRTTAARSFVFVLLTNSGVFFLFIMDFAGFGVQSTQTDEREERRRWRAGLVGEGIGGDY